MSEIEEQKPAASAAAKEAEPASEKEVINTFQNLRQEVQQLFSKINELENEKSEHTLVIGASLSSTSNAPRRFSLSSVCARRVYPPSRVVSSHSQGRRLRTHLFSPLFFLFSGLGAGGGGC